MLLGCDWRFSIYICLLLRWNIVKLWSKPHGGSLPRQQLSKIKRKKILIFPRILNEGPEGGYKSHFPSPNFSQIPFLSLLFFQILKIPVPVLLFFCLWFPFPVTKSQSQWPKCHFPSENLPKSQFPFYPFRTLLNLRTEEISLWTFRIVVRHEILRG